MKYFLFTLKIETLTVKLACKAVLCALLIGCAHAVGAATSAAQTPVNTFSIEAIENRVDELRQSLTRPAVVAIGYDAVETALKTGDPTVPVFGLFLSSTEYAALIEKHGAAIPMTAIFGNPEPRAQLALAEQLFPKGTFALVETPVSRPTIEQLSRPYTKVVQVRDDITQLIRQLVGIDALVALPDPDGVNSQNIGFIIRSMYRQGSVVIGYSQKMVNMGCLASIYPRPEAVIAALQHAIRSYNKTGKLPEPQFVGDHAIGINRRLARSLDLVIPEKEQLLRNIHAEVHAR